LNTLGKEDAKESSDVPHSSSSNTFAEERRKKYDVKDYDWLKNLY